MKKLFEFVSVRRIKMHTGQRDLAKMYRWLLAGLSVVLLSSCAKLIQPNIEQSLIEIKPGNYTLDKKHATVLFKVNHMGFSTFVGRFNSFDASLQYDSENITKSTLQAVIDMDSVDVNDEKFERALRGKFWFNAETYPQAVFTTTAAQRVGDNRVKFSGTLNFLGVEKPIELLVTVNGAANNILTGKYTLGFAGQTSFNRSEFGLDRYVPTVGDKVDIEVHAEFQKE